MDLATLPALDGSMLFDPWRIRLRLQLAGQLQEPQRLDRGPTPSEEALWSGLEHEPPGWFREYSTGLYRLDFYCPEARVAVEVDGGSHYGRARAERDALRDAWHRARGITTHRLSADHVERDLDGALALVRQWVAAAIGQPVDEPVPPSPAVDAPHGLDDQVLARTSGVAAAVAAGVTALAQPTSGPAAASGTDEPVVTDQAASGPADPAETLAASLTEALTDMALLAAETGADAQAVLREAEHAVAHACVDVLPHDRPALVAEILRRAGLPVRQRSGAPA